jgi:hypothetical protein
MDMMPPQAPPALTQGVYQDAAAAFDRLTALQAWLAGEQAAMPALPDAPGSASMAVYVADIEVYWDAAPAQGGGSSRRAALARRLAGAARDLAELGHHDGHLDAAVLATIRTLTAVSVAGLPAQLSVRELTLGDTPYAGVLLVQDTQAPGRVLAFSTDCGWESFDSLTDAHAMMERRYRRALATRNDLPGLARQHTLRIGPEAVVNSRELAADPFATLVDRMVDVQRDKLRQAAFAFALESNGNDGDEASTTRLIDSVHDALDLDRAIDVPALLAVRHAALVETLNSERLARVPAAVAADWRQAEAEYLTLLHALTGDEATVLPAPLDLPTFARQALVERLRVLGVTQAPDDITVRIDRSADPSARLASLQALFEGTAPAHIGLLDLAYQNIAIFDPVRLTATTSEGSPIAALDDATLRRIVRELDLASRYRAYVDTTFRSGEQAAARRAQAADTQLVHMRLQAAEARLSYYLSDAPRSFADDHGERGYRWVKAVLDAPVAANRMPVEDHDVVVRQMTYQDIPLRDVLAIGVRQPESVRSIVLYTPDAPDGVVFREFADRAEAGRRFFYDPAFREYLLDRLPADQARLLPNGTAREFAGDHLAHWVLGSGASSGYTRTAAPFQEREISGDFLDAAYQVDVQLGLRNASTFTRSAEHAQWNYLVDVSRTSMSQRLLASAVEGVVTAPARAAQAAWRLYDTVKAGDDAQAVVDFAEFYNASLMAAAPVYALGAAPLARSFVGARFRVGARLVEARPATAPAVVFESRFAAHGVRRTGQPNREGIFAIDGKTYIEHRGQLYAARYDTDYATWRLARPDASAAFRGPAIERGLPGTWQYRSVGLRGGSGRGPAGRSAAYRDHFDEYTSELEQAFPDAFERDLVRTQMRAELTGQGPATALAPAQRARWNAATLRAHERARQAVNAGPAYPVVEDLTVPRVPAARNVPGGYRQVVSADVPNTLWYYGRKPFKYSGFERQLTSRGFNHNWANVRAEFIEPGLNGVRLTTLPPTASMNEINAATGLNLSRARAFAVRIDPRNLLTTYGHITEPRAVLFSVNRSDGTGFVLRPNSGPRIMLYRAEYQVMDVLPAHQ